MLEKWISEERLAQLGGAIFLGKGVFEYFVVTNNWYSIVCSGAAGAAFFYQGLRLQNNQKDHWAGYLVSAAALGITSKMHWDNGNYALFGVDTAFAAVSGLGALLSYYGITAHSEKKQIKQSPETLESKLLLAKEYATQQQLEEAFRIYNNVLDDARELDYKQVVNEANAHLFVAHVQQAILHSQNGEKRLTNVSVQMAERYMRQFNNEIVSALKTLPFREFEKLFKTFGNWLKEYKYPWAQKIREKKEESTVPQQDTVTATTEE